MKDYTTNLRKKLLDVITLLESERINMPKSLNKKYLRAQSAMVNAEISLSVALEALNQVITDNGEGNGDD